MDFNYTTETIIPDNTGMITIGGTQGLELPAGSTSQRPTSPAAGTLRFTTANNTLEYWNGTTWYSLVNTSSGVTSFSAGTTGLTPNTATTGAVTLAGTLNVASGGTGITAAPSSGQLLIGNGSGYNLATLTASLGIAITNASGSITITNAGVINNVAGTGISLSGSTGTVIITNAGVTSAAAGTGISVSSSTGGVTITNTGVTSITGTANQITASSSTGGVTLSLPSSLSLSTVSATSITDSGLTPNSFIYPGTGGLLTSTAAATNGQLLIGSTGSAPVAGTLTGGLGIIVTNAAGNITVTNSNATTGYVTVGASATSQGTATPLPYAFNIINGTSGGNAVLLPTPTGPGQYINVENRSGAGVMIYPQSGAQIENLGVNAGISTNVGQGGYNFISGSSTQWYFTQTLYTNGPGMSLVAATSGLNGVLQFNNAGVLSFSGGTTGLTPNSGTTGNITLGGTLAAANGGTGLSTAPSANGQLLIGSSTGTYTLATLTAGTGIAITNTAGGISIATSGGVTSDQGTANQILVNGATTAQTGANVFTIAPNVILPGTASETIPSGTTAQRPATPTVAMMRYNTTEDILEGYASIGTGYAGVGGTGTNAFVDNIILPKSLTYRKRRQWYDEFVFGTAQNSTSSNGTFGELMWSSYATATPVNSIITGITDHPGILSIATAASNNAQMSIFSGVSGQPSILPAQIEYASFLVRIPVINTANFSQFNVGFVDNISSTLSNGIFFQLYTGFSYWLTVTYAGGTETYTPTIGINAVANTWYLLEMWNTGTAWVFAINGTVVQVQTTNLPTGAVQPFVQVVNSSSSTTSVAIQIDAFSMITKELGNRY